MTSVINTADIKTIEQKEQVRLRPDMYIGSSEIRQFQFLDQDFQQKTGEYQQSGQKLFDEIIQNSMDNFFKSNEKNYYIKVKYFSDGTFQIKNNGSVFDMRKDQGQDIQRIFEQLNTSSQYDSKTKKNGISGTNGYGAKLTNIFSEEFKVINVQNNKKYKCEWKNGNFSQRFLATEVEKQENSFIVQFKLQKQFYINIDYIYKYLIDLQMVYPQITFYFNNQSIQKYSLQEWLLKNDIQEYVIVRQNDLTFIGFQKTKLQRFTLLNGIHYRDSNGTHYNLIEKKVGDIGQIFIGRYPLISTSSQIKDSVGSKIEINFTPQQIDTLKSFCKQKQQRKMNKQVFTNKLIEANNRNQECTLILTEGDSALGLFRLIQNQTKKLFNHYGVFPLKGKVKNVQKSTEENNDKNQELINIQNIIGLDKKIKEINIQKLRYQHILIASDYDEDGFHIKGLLINFIHKYWPCLLETDFIQEFMSPIVIQQNKEFFSLQIFDREKTNQPADYFKGLGSFDQNQVKRFIGENGKINSKYIKNIKYDQNDTFLLESLFGKEVIQRKNLIKQYNYIDEDRTQKNVSMKYILNQVTEYYLSTLSRAIPQFIDGLKQSQRKIIYYCLQHLNKKTKVEQLASMISASTDYHHGEVSLQDTICLLAQDFVGTNQLELLTPRGNFGTRMDPKNISAPRYIYVERGKYLDKIFRSDDKIIYNYLKSDDNENIEPESLYPIIPLQLVNGCLGLASGWSTQIYQYNVKQIIDFIIGVLQDKEDVYYPMIYYKGYTGKVSETTDNKVKCDADYSFTVQGDIYKYIIRDTILETCISDLYEFLKTQKIESKLTDTLIFECNEVQSNQISKKFLHSLKKNTNMNLTDKNGIVKEYTNMQDILEDWIQERKSIYERRKYKQMQYLIQQYIILYYQIVIIDYCDKMNKPEFETILQEKCLSYNFILQIRDQDINIVKNKLSKGIYLKEQQVDKKIKYNFDYIKLKTISFYNSLDKTKLQEKELQYKKYQEKRIEDIWISELKELQELI